MTARVFGTKYLFTSLPRLNHSFMHFLAFNMLIKTRKNCSLFSVEKFCLNPVSNLPVPIMNIFTGRNGHELIPCAASSTYFQNILDDVEVFLKKKRF